MRFVIKIFLGTILVVYLMQLRVDGKTIEAHTYNFLAHSKWSVFINTVAKGLVEMGTDIKDAVTKEIKKAEKKI